MKNVYKILLLSVAGLVIFLGACKKEPKIVSQVVRVQYPLLVLNGAEYVSIMVGGSFTDPGAKMYDSITGIWTDPLAPTQSAVDPNTPGMYPIVYEGTNKYGFKSQIVRWVAVTNISASEDISGLYKRTANGSPMNVTKIATGIYSVDNIGGVNGIPEYIYPLYFVQLSDSTVDFPPQNGPFGITSTKNEKLTKSSSDTTLAWVVVGPGFGTALRTFSHQ